ncbi:MAG: 50S ribosomal protein L22 [Deltaproteobacteria bacterium]|nr:50S ribosomal protein L22 [Deltaproteobacteria bacterium]
MEAKAVAKFIRVSPRKTRIVAKNVVGRPVEDALNVLRFTPQKGAQVIREVMKSALANAEHNTNMNVDALVVKEILVNEGPTWKRFMPRAQGRATSIRKRTSHVTVILAEN